jgi:hypothetical protein
MILGNTSTLARSKTGLRVNIKKKRFPFCTPLPSRGGCSRYYQKNKKEAVSTTTRPRLPGIAFVFIATAARSFQRANCHASETGIQSFLDTIFNGSSDADDAIQFINNHNLTMLFTRRTYVNPSTYTDDVVALLSWTGRNKPVVYIGWATMSGGQLSDPVHLPSLLADSKIDAYGFPVGPGLPYPIPNWFTWLGIMTVMFELMELATCRYKKIKSPYIYLHVNPNESATNTSPQPFWTKRGFDPVNKTLVITPLTATEDKTPLLIQQNALKTTAQAELLTDLDELREHFMINPKDEKNQITMRAW